MRSAAAVAIALFVGCAASEPAPKRALAPVTASTATHERSGPTGDVPEAPSAAPVESVTPVASAEPPTPVCNPQQAFEFLVRKSYIPVKTKKAEHRRALEWRTKTYGYVKGFGEPGWNPKLAKQSAVDITLFGLPVTVNEKIVPALRCAEAEVKASCGAFPYTPKVLAGMRNRNTYRGGEVTNHMYGIAVDLDPQENSCCGCVEKWKKSPLCKKKAKSIWERMAMPKCWVDAFEKYGFYWLGHDKLQDTMHFEFLADPDKVMVVPEKQLATNP